MRKNILHCYNSLQAVGDREIYYSIPNETSTNIKKKKILNANMYSNPKYK